MQSYLSLQKSWGSFHLISRSIGLGLLCMLIFLFQNIPAGKQYKLVVFGEFSPGSRPISNGLNVRRVLRVSIIIKKLFFFFFCLYFEAVVNSQVFREVIWHVEPSAGRHFHAAGGGADLPTSLSIAGSGHPRAGTIMGGLLTCHSCSTPFWPTLLLSRHWNVGVGCQTASIWLTLRVCVSFMHSIICSATVRAKIKGCIK